MDVSFLSRRQLCACFDVWSLHYYLKVCPKLVQVHLEIKAAYSPPVCLETPEYFFCATCALKN